MEKAIFGAGCFWGVQAAFDKTPGVVATEAGYSGGTTKNPSYESVCSHLTGHAEVVRVTFNPEEIAYTDLVETFFAIHDPTQVNRQGPDIGDEYRSVIFFFSAEQEQMAQEVKERLQNSGRYRKPIATLIEPAKEFWRAEEYHQKWHEKHGGTYRI